jgi:serpin B
MNTRSIASLVFATTLLAPVYGAEPADPFATATNALGLDLYRVLAAESGNICLSPYSIQAAFGMTTNGAAGATLEEMRKALHLPDDLGTLNDSYAELVANFDGRADAAAKWAARMEDDEPAFQLAMANRLFGQEDYPFEPAFLGLLKDKYAAPLQLADFKTDFEAERIGINDWVSEQTKERIENLLPEDSLTETTRLVLVNALHFKAAWREEFTQSLTEPAAFHLGRGAKADVPTMHRTARFGHAEEDGYTAVSLPYSGGCSMLLIVPDEADGLATVAQGLTAAKLSSLARLPYRKVTLALPKFKIEGATVPLREPLEELGMKLAFDQKLADFGPMTSDKDLPGLYISNAYHKTFISVDEEGTEAAAATAVVMAGKSAAPRPEKPVVVRVDRPFFYAIMDGQSRTALFIGRVTDPR